MRFANALLEQNEQTPVIEAIEGGLKFTAVEKPVAVSIVGDISGILQQADGSQCTITGWRSYLLDVGEFISLSRTGRYRCAVIGIKDITLAPHFNSTSTYSNAALGGLNGSRLNQDDVIPTANLDNLKKLRCKQMPAFAFAGENAGPSHYNVRAVLGPQDDAFTPASINSFFQQHYTVSQEIDRMGARLSGQALEHKSDQHKDLVSDAILPGSVQIPGIGTPIVMLADAHTVGGYPKIATVITADLALFALCRPDDTIQFTQVSAEEGRDVAIELEQLFEQHLRSICSVVDTLFNSDLLLTNNLISGVTDALNFDEQK